MDRNAITGMILIAAILGVFFWLSTPSAEDRDRYLSMQDSLQKARLIEEQIALEQKNLELAQSKTVADTTGLSKQLQDQYGTFANAAVGTQQFITIENNLMKVVLSTKGGRIYSVELKEYKTYDGKPLILFDGDKNRFGFTFTHNNRLYETDQLFFTILKKSESSADLALNTTNGQSMVYHYELTDDSYMMNYSVNSDGLKEILGKKQTILELTWAAEMPMQEKARKIEISNSGVYFKYYQDEVDWMRSTSDESKEVRSKLKWIGYKDQFFSSVLISKEIFNGANIESLVPQLETDTIIRQNKAVISVPLTSSGAPNEFSFYFGPNHYYTLNSFGEELELNRLIHLGWGFLGWINRVSVIPVFNYFKNFVGNYGLIILLLTILIKLVLFPLTYKSYISTAKMKVLKPQIDEINSKIPKDKPMERQQATMALYKKAGVNPLGGCLPMLLQFPILIAMFNFFPASIELRQQPFLWAEDLSSFDAIVSWTTNIPLLSSTYGNHISLFCLLMAAANILYTWMNQEMTQSSQTMPGMKTMMYLMPVIFLVFFNSSSSGLSYYYFISTVITIGQTLLIRRFVDEKALLAKIHANQKKPVTKSKFQMKLEEMQKKQQQLQRKK